MRIRMCLVLVVLVLALAACRDQSAVPVAPAAAQFQPIASVQELMHTMVDPSADALWDAVGSTITAKGSEDRQPRTDAEWQQARYKAIILIEAMNLLAMEGRRLVPPGGKILDEGVEGVLSSQEGQERLESQHEKFVQFTRAMRDVGAKMLTAIDAKQPEAMMDVGTDMNDVCEACHMTFWYPNQRYPKLTVGFD